MFEQYNREMRRKNPPAHAMYCVDDRTELDVASDRSLFGFFCEIFANVSEAPQIKVQLSGNVPMGPEVAAWIERYGATLMQTPKTLLSFSMQQDQTHKLIELAQAIEIITKRPYGVSSYKYVCPRTGASLRRLSGVLDQAS